MNPLVRKKPAVRLFAGLVGHPAEETPKPEFVISDPDQAVPSVEEIQAQIITDYDSKVKSKRGRPPVGAKAMSPAERKRKSRAREVEQQAKKAVTAAMIAEIAEIRHKHRDDAGRLHGEMQTGGNAVQWIVESMQEDTGRGTAPGCDPDRFLSGGYNGVKETRSQWALRQNFRAAAKWDNKEKAAYTEELTRRCCIEEYHCMLGDFVGLSPEEVEEHFRQEHRQNVHLADDGKAVNEQDAVLPDNYFVTKFRCIFNDVVSENYDEVIRHFTGDHRGYIRRMIRYHEPRHIRVTRTYSDDELNFVTSKKDGDGKK